MTDIPEKASASLRKDAIHPPGLKAWGFLAWLINNTLKVGMTWKVFKGMVR